MADSALSGGTISTVTSVAYTDLAYLETGIGGTPGDGAVQAGVFGPMVMTTLANSSTTMAVNKMHVLAGSALSADRTYTLPASPTTGDRCGIMLSSGSASFEAIIVGNTSQTINGSASTAAEWSRLFIAGESAIFRYIGSNAWIVESDGRIPMTGTILLITASSGETPGTIVQPTAFSGVWTADTDIGSICTIASDRITARRACYARVSAVATTTTTVTSAKYFTLLISKNVGATTVSAAEVIPGANGTGRLNAAAVVRCAVDDYFVFRYRTEQGSVGLGASVYPAQTNSLSFNEIL